MTGETTSAWQRHRAARTVAGLARDAADLAELLEMLGLTAAEGRDLPVETQPEAPRKRVPRLDPPSACRINRLMRVRRS
ncbi:hypothetical protein [Actinophytocola sp. NPDC049390]|uniref:hypothetical protein n=1 Tax=Actinophytocola sp. NPDC049390 TaxID=3363894 RepID=UPI0037B716C4